MEGEKKGSRSERHSKKLFSSTRRGKGVGMRDMDGEVKEVGVKDIQKNIIKSMEWVKDILKNYPLDGEVKGVAMKDTQKNN